KEGLVLRSPQPPIAEGADHPDDLDVGRSVGPVPQAQAGPDRAAVPEVAPREALVDDRGAEARSGNGDPLPIERVPLVEIASREEWHSQGVEETGADGIAVDDAFGHDPGRRLDGELLIQDASRTQLGRDQPANLDLAQGALSR